MKNIQLSLLILIISISVLAVASFFMVWVKGAGVVSKPMTESSKNIQHKQSSAIAQKMARTVGSVIDSTTEAVGKVAKIELKKTLTGYQIPFSKSKETKTIGKAVYSLFALPILALLCAMVSFFGSKSKIFDLLSLLMAVIGFVILYVTYTSLTSSRMFIVKEISIGFWLCFYSFIALMVLSLTKFILSFFNRGNLKSLL